MFQEVRKQITNIIHNLMAREGYDPELTHIRVKLGFSKNPRLMAQRGFGGVVTVFPWAHLRDVQKSRGVDIYAHPEVLGESLLRSVLHEVRHEQQECLWDLPDGIPALPRVSQKAKRDPDSTEFRTTAQLDAYWADPGEKDARDFSERALREVDPHLKVLLGRATRRWCGATRDEFAKFLNQTPPGAGERRAS